jgi:alkylation response protein AidB-like acyl-CoA dehydrogenase
MDARLSPEQKALRDSVAQLVQRLGPGSVAALSDAERRDKLEAAVAAAGWRELRDADDDGQPYASAVEVAIVAEELSRGLADAAFLGPVLASELRRRAGLAPADRAETVMFVADLSGPAVVDPLPDGALAIDAAGARSALVLTPHDNRYVLGNASFADAPSVDLTRAVGAVGEVLALTASSPESGLGDEDLAAWTAFGLAVTSAELLGVMRGALDLAVAYAKTRHQYGSAIGSYQAVQHLLADAHVHIEGSRSVVLHAAWAVDALAAPEALAAGAVAKAYCSRAALSVCETAIQVHGGIGNTWECLAHVFLRRALLSTDVLGGANANIGRVLDGHGLQTRGAG